jgi:hypothetical protein
VIRSVLRPLALVLALSGMGEGHAQFADPPPHTGSAPLYSGANDQQVRQLADAATTVEHDRDPRFALVEHRRLERALAAVQPQRPGVVDAYVISVALDSDGVFGREAREAGRVLARRYDAAGRTIALDMGADDARGSPDNLAAALARVAEVMDPKEDVLVLYTTSHGAPWGVVYNDSDSGFGAISPTWLWLTLQTLGIQNRLLLLSACYSGVFVPMLQSDTTAIVTAASADRTSFGCQADADWTFFGDALVNGALRKSQPFASAAAEAQRTIAGWEKQGDLTPSQPQVSIGTGAARWLAALEQRMPRVPTPPVGRPATTLLDKLVKH